MDHIAVTNIAEAIRASEDLNSFLSNYLNSERMEIKGKEITDAEASEYLDKHTRLIIAQLSEALKLLRN